MSYIQICDLCDTKLESKYHVCSLFTIDNAQIHELTRANERFELCPECYKLIKNFIDCMRSDIDTLVNILGGDDHDES